jgi:hypothetical protein
MLILFLILLALKSIKFYSEINKYVKTYIDDCAKVFVDLAQNTSITGQQIVVGEFVHQVIEIIFC